MHTLAALRTPCVTFCKDSWIYSPSIFFSSLPTYTFMACVGFKPPWYHYQVVLPLVVDSLDFKLFYMPEAELICECIFPILLDGYEGWGIESIVVFL